MGEKQHTFFVVDDDEFSLEITCGLLQKAGHQVRRLSSSLSALAEVPVVRPDCLICDIMMPDLDGLELCRQLRARPELAEMKIIVLTAKSYEFDRKRAFSYGAAGYLLKPIDLKTFVRDVEAIVEDRISLDFWGVRGSIPVPGPRSLRYGGNTCCVSLRLPQESLLVFDAGSGIKELGNFLLSQGRKRIDGKILISHPHWDHINGLPFFAPLYIQGNDFEICGPSQGSRSIRDWICAQMDDIYFPVTVREFAGHVYYTELRESTINIAGLEVQTMLLNHPGYCLGYRVEYHGRSICYITDNELFPPGAESYSAEYVKRLTRFVAAADVLITDCNYTDEVYLESKIGWGHSSVTEVCELAANADVKTLYLYHHDPDQCDDDIDGKLEAALHIMAQKNDAVTVKAAAESATILV